MPPVRREQGDQYSRRPQGGRGAPVPMHRRLARTVVAAAIAGILSEPFGWVSGAAASAAPPIAAVPRMKRLESQWHDPAPPVGVAEDVPAVELNLAEQYVPPVYIDESLAPSSFQTLPDQSFPLDVEEEPQLPPGARAGIFQKWRFSGTWLPQLSSDSIGISELSTSVVLGFPFLRRDTPLLITPFFRVKYLDRPQSPDLPPRVFDTGVEFRHMRKFNERWAMDVAVTTGAYSDFAQGSSDVFRVSGRGLAVYSSSPATKWILGVVYLNRAGASVVPAAGVMYQPHDVFLGNWYFPVRALPGAFRGHDSSVAMNDGPT